MTNKSLLLLVIAFFFLVEISAKTTLGGRRGAMLGGWSPIEDVKDPHVQELGEFAVSEHNKEAKTDLKFGQVVKGESQVVAGENFRLVLEANDGSATNNYEAVVWERAWLHSMNLTSFRQL